MSMSTTALSTRATVSATTRHFLQLVGLFLGDDTIGNGLGYSRFMGFLHRGLNFFLRQAQFVKLGKDEVTALIEGIAQTGACRKWWDYMGDIMVNNPDGTPWSAPLEEVFHHEISPENA